MALNHIAKLEMTTRIHQVTLLMIDVYQWRIDVCYLRNDASTNTPLILIPTRKLHSRYTHKHNHFALLICSQAQSLFKCDTLSKHINFAFAMHSQNTVTLHSR